MIQHLGLRMVLVAALLFAAPLGAQPVGGPLEKARAAQVRLEFAAALAALADAISDRPDAPAALLARADLHRMMNRPSLALADLGTLLARDPANRDALRARADLHLALGALARARADFDAAIEAAPNDVAALVGRARARTRSGLAALAVADYDAALALAPDRPGLAEERAALTRPAPTGLRYDPAALMDPAFMVAEGTPGAVAQLVIVHAGNDLAHEEALMPRAALAPALAAGALGVTHLFTYTGQDSAIWANLALICAGPEGFSPTWAALAGEPARAALEAIDAGTGRSDFEAVVSATYAGAGLDAARGSECAFSRTKALGYLADWTDKREAEAWRGSSFFDAWPVFVLDGTVVNAAELREALSALAPPEPEATAAAPVSPQVPQAETEANQPPTPETAVARPMGEAEPKPELEPQPAPTREPEPAPEHAPRPAGFGPVDDAARIPAELRGIWAPTLIDCIAYSNAIAAPDRLDSALPALNPLEGPPIGTVLLTSRRMLLFNAVATGCDLVSTDANDATPWAARLACRNGLVSGIVAPMSLSRVDGVGPAPRLTVSFGNHGELELLQCRPLGALGRDFALLWQVGGERCTVSAPVTGARFDFTVDTGALVLTITPDGSPDQTAGSTLAVTLDGALLQANGAWQAGAWRIDLGPFEAVADRLATGLLMEATATAPGDEAGPWARILPLLGSNRAMAALADCAGG